MALRREESERANDQASRVIEEKLGQATRRANPFSLVKNLNDAEQKSTAASTANSNDLKSAEESTAGQTGGEWENKFTGNTKNNQAKGNSVFKFLNRKGPLAIIISLILGSGIGISIFFSPALLIINLKEVLTNNLNTQLTAMEFRTNKLLAKKFGVTTGYCGQIITIRCKYSTLSDKQLANFEKAGIKVITDEKSTITGRKKPTSLEFEGKSIKASEFIDNLGANPNFRSAVRIAYNPKLGGFIDSVWKKAANLLRINKRATPIEGDNFDEKMKSVEENIKESSGFKRTPHITEEELGKEIDPDTNKPYSENTSKLNQVLEETNNRIDSLNDLVKIAGPEEGSGTVSKIISSAENVHIANTIKITGAFDSVCTIYRTIKATSYAAKTLRTIQLASYAMMVLKAADQAKAGDGNTGDMSFLGDVLTKTSKDDFGNDLAATDSVGYKYNAYNEVPSFMPTSAVQFMVAGGLAGSMAKILEKVPGNLPSTTCRILGNPIVGFVSAAAGIALGVATGGLATTLLNAAKGIASVGTALAIGEAVLPNLLKDIVAGNLVDETTIGANAGNAIASGAAVIMGTTAKYGGNAPLTPEQAVAYNSKTQEVLAMYAEEDRATHSPFDISNSNTFMGSIVSGLIPYISKMSTASGAISSIASISLNPFALLSSQTAKAASASNYSTCSDYDYRDLNLATDPFCNVIYGIPVSHLDKDPIDVVDEMVNSGQINSETGEPIANSDYSDFLTNCVNRIDPLGDDTTSSSDGSRCILNKPDSYPANFYLYFIDQRVETGMENY